MLKEQERRLSGADGEVLLHLFAFIAAEGWIGHHHLIAVLLLNVGEVLRERIGVDDVWGLDAVQDHVHDRDDVGERLLLLPVEGALLERLHFLGRQTLLRTQVVKGLAKEAGRADGAITDALPDMRLDHFDNGTYERAWRVILTAVAPGVAHVPDFGFVEVRQLVFFGLRAEAQLVNMIDDLAEVVTARILFLISPKIWPILYSRVFGPLAFAVKPCRYGKSFPFTKSRRSSPVIALLWSRLPSLPLGAAHVPQR